MRRGLRILKSSLEKATDPRLAPPKDRCPGTYFLFDPSPHRRPHARILRKASATVSNTVSRNRRFETSGLLVASNQFPHHTQHKRMPLRPILPLWPGRSDIHDLAQYRRVRGATPTRLTDLRPLPLPCGTRTRQRRQRIPLRNRPILSATVRRTPPTTRKSRRERCIERPAIHAGLSTGHNFGDCHCEWNFDGPESFPNEPQSPGFPCHSKPSLRLIPTRYARTSKLSWS